MILNMYALYVQTLQGLNGWLSSSLRLNVLVKEFGSPLLPLGCKCRFDAFLSVESRGSGLIESGPEYEGCIAALEATAEMSINRTWSWHKQKTFGVCEETA